LDRKQRFAGLISVTILIDIVNNGTGKLSGYAWIEAVGRIDFVTKSMA